MSDAAIALALPLIREFEGCRLEPYQDVVSVWTIGWGNTVLPDGSPVTADTGPLSQAEADGMLEAMLRDRAAEIDALLPEDATPNQAAALYCFAWNLGVSALEHSTLLRRFAAGDIDGAACEFGKWTHAGGRELPGLVRRREAERRLFLRETI